MRHAFVTLMSIVLAAGPESTTASPPPVPEARAPRFLDPAQPVVAMARPPLRIVSLAPVATETLAALGVFGRVVGVTRFCDTPAEALLLPKVGGFTDPSLERIVALEPDLVVALPSLGQRQLLERLASRGIPVFVGFTDTVSEVRSFVTTLGRVLKVESRARTVVSALDDALKRAPRTTCAPRVLVVVGSDPLVAAGPGTFPMEAVLMLGGTSAVPSGGPLWPTLSLEALATLKPDVIVVAEGPAATASVRAAVARLWAAAPPIKAADRAILMRPGPGLANDIGVLAGLLQEPDVCPAGAP